MVFDELALSLMGRSICTRVSRWEGEVGWIKHTLAVAYSKFYA